MRGGRAIWIVAIVLPLVLLVPFINKPVHIDDAAYIPIAKHIAAHPFDYYGLSLNWYGVEAPVYEWHASPPLANYYLAFIGSLFGWQEWVLHTGFLLPALMASIGTSWLALRLCRYPLLALTATLCTPVYVVSCGTLMLDSWLLAFFTISIAAWVEGFERGQLRWLVFASVCAGLAAWTKYFGIALVPLLFVYGRAKSVRPRWWWLCLAIPVAMLTAEQSYGYVRYGRFLFQNVAHVVSEDRIGERAWWEWLLVGFSFAGGCTFSVMQLGAILWEGRLRLFGTVLWIVISCMLLLLDAAGIHVFTLGRDLPAFSLIVYSVLILGGSQLITLSVSEVRHRGEPASWLLALWITGTFFFTVAVTWSVNARSLMPLIPAAAILAARRLEFIDPPKTLKLRRRIVTIIVISALVSLALARADMEWAAASREAALRLSEYAKAEGRTTYYQGHWGFQHYMSEAGMTHMDYDQTVLQPGDFVICPGNNANVCPLPDDYTAQRFLQTFPIEHRMATMSDPLGAGFYTDLWGPLPFALGLKMPPDPYYIYIVAKSGKPFEVNL